jgi:two-component system, cell cycle sensor histidine kinase and response regulator CckA
MGKNREIVGEGRHLEGGYIEMELKGPSLSTDDDPEKISREEMVRLLLAKEDRQRELESENRELRSVQGRLEETLARYTDLFNFAPVGYLTIAPDGLILEVNFTLATCFGAERESMAGRLFREFVVPEDNPLFAGFLAETCRSGNRQECELRLRRPHGSIFWAMVQSSGRMDADDRPVCRASVLDITSRKETEETVREQRNLLKTIFREMPGLHSLKDRNFSYQYVNPAFHRFLGRKKDAILGQTDFALLPRQKARKYRQEDLEVVESGLPLVREEDVSTPLFGKKWLQINKIPVKDKEGEVVGIISSIIDITERKKMENELLKIEKLQSIGVLAGGIAHDFNNLLTGILGNIELAKMYTDAESKAHHRLVQAEKASLAAKNLTRQLLTFSHGGAPVTRTASVVELVRESTEFILRGARVQPFFDLPDDLWLAEIDSGQISQVIQNLVKNGEQAMPEGGSLVIRVRNVKVTKQKKLPLKGGCYLEFSVRDEGQGIPERNLGRIFDPYFTTKPRGSGLGLAICYSIIKQHQGYLEAESQPGAGAVFRFYLPASSRKVEGESRQQEVSLAGQGRILVMDDNENVKEIAGEMLRHIGYQVDFAADGLEAIKAWIKARRLGNPFAVVLMDLTVRGGMGGREAASKLLELDPDARMVATSGYSTDPVITDYRKYGFSGAVHKPFRMQELSTVLQAALDDQQQLGS